MLTKTDIEHYFNAEKNESLLFICVGIAAIVLALVFFFYLKKHWCKGAAIPLLVIGLVHLVAGTVVFNRSDKDRMRIVYAYDMDPSVLQTKEIPRMEQVNKNFLVYRYTEMACILTGLALVLFFIKKTGRSFWVGLGAALALEAAISLTADYFAEKRAAKYEQQLKEWSQYPRKTG
ncbi:MAG: hypothetical protein JWP81_1241 [Ferruginibacter sp.]|nr:hypothetical protein [Ferruginibacter sp.]